MPAVTPENQTDLLLRAAKGDESAFSELFYAAHERLIAFLWKLTGSRETAKDIAQEVFIKIWEKKEALHEIRHFDAYIYTLARNQALNTLRSKARERVRHQRLAREALADGPSPEPSPDYHSLLDEAVDNLPPQQQKVYVLSRRKHQSYHQIAEQMELSSETVKKYLKLATRTVTSYLRANVQK
jgi:RNA polymerase sigma-70 factor (ECF subfamily)